MQIELFGLPPIEFTAEPNYFKVTLYSPRTFAKMSAQERLEACYQRRAGGVDTPGRLALDDDHAALLTALDSPCSVEELCRLMAISSFEVCRSLWAFRVIGLVQRVEPGEGEIDDEGLGDVLGEE